MKINRKRRVTVDWLLPGWKLDEPLAKQASAISGELFEVLTGTILKGERRTLDSTTDVCPDLIDDANHAAAESKASNRRSGFKIHQDQLERYEKMAADGWQIVYCLWLYGAVDIAKSFATVGECVKGMLSTVELVTVMDVRMIRYLVDSDIAGIQYYPEWSAKTSKLQGFANPLWVIRPTLLRRLLTEDLSLGGLFDSHTREHRPNQKTRIDYNGKEFATSEFDLLIYEHTDDVAPF